jgi:hypothetical protein
MHGILGMILTTIFRIFSPLESSKVLRLSCVFKAPTTAATMQFGNTQLMCQA